MTMNMSVDTRRTCVSCMSGSWRELITCTWSSVPACYRWKKENENLPSQSLLLTYSCVSSLIHSFIRLRWLFCCLGLLLPVPFMLMLMLVIWNKQSDCNWLVGWMDGWVDGYVGGWMDGWMCAWVDRWMDVLIDWLSDRREQGLLLYERRRRASVRSSLAKSYERYERTSSSSPLAAAAASVDPLAASRVQLLPSN